MSVIHMTKAQMVEALAAHGEIAPGAWTKVQLMARLTEIKDAALQAATWTEKDVVKEINRCKTRADLRVLMDKKGLEWNKNQTIADLKKVLFEMGMRNVIPTAEDAMGFGKFAHLTFGEVYTLHPNYKQWCIQTMEEETDCRWRLKRFAGWAANLTQSEINNLSLQVQQTAKSKAMPKSRMTSRASGSSAPSIQSTEWEMAEEKSMTVEAEKSKAQIEEVENRL